MNIFRIFSRCSISNIIHVIVVVEGRVCVWGSNFHSTLYELEVCTQGIFGKISLSVLRSTLRLDCDCHNSSELLRWQNIFKSMAPPILFKCKEKLFTPRREGDFTLHKATKFQQNNKEKNKIFSLRLFDIERGNSRTLEFRNLLCITRAEERWCFFEFPIRICFLQKGASPHHIGHWMVWRFSLFLKLLVR